jgi:hypothetical protein
MNSASAVTLFSHIFTGEGICFLRNFFPEIHVALHCTIILRTNELCTNLFLYNVRSIAIIVAVRRMPYTSRVMIYNIVFACFEF